jgi:uncharacterized protein (TIGR02598 family)
MKRALTSSGFSLVEVTLALGVAAFSLIAIFGLLVTGTQTNHTAVEQSASSDILTAVAADLRATPKTSPVAGATVSPQFRISIPANPVKSGATPTPTTIFFSSQGQCSTSLDGSTNCFDGSTWSAPLQIRYRLTISFLVNDPGTVPARTATFVDLRTTWPARADPAGTNTGGAETFIALDRN